MKIRLKHLFIAIVCGGVCLTAIAQKQLTRLSLSNGFGLAQVKFSENNGFYNGSNHGDADLGSGNLPSERLTSPATSVNPTLVIERTLPHHLKLLLGVSYSRMSFSTPAIIYNSYHRRDYFHPGNPSIIDSSRTYATGSQTFHDSFDLVTYGAFAGLGFTTTFKRWVFDADLSFRVQTFKPILLKRAYDTPDKSGSNITPDDSQLFFGAGAQLKAAYRLYKGLYVQTGLSYVASYSRMTYDGTAVNINGVIVGYNLSRLQVFTLNAGIMLQL